MDELLKRVAELRGMPASLVERSARARAEKMGSTLEAVLQEWAGEAVSAAADSPEDSATDSEAPVSEPDDVPAPVEVTTDHLVRLAADAKRMPPKLILSSATARAEHSGSSLEEVLADWAGVDLEELRQQAADVVPVAVPEPPVDEEPVDEEPTVESPEPKAEIEVIEASPPEVDDSADEDIPVVRGGYPRWLAAAFVLIPLLGVAYILVAPNGPDCGTAGQLLVDPATGQALNCDGSQYGVDAADYLAEGAALYSQCVACHGADGSGPVGPAFSGGAILSTFPAGSCDQHIAWVDLGTAGWPDPTYGATDIPVGSFGLMPAFGVGMTDAQIAAVSLYERVEFGGQPLEDAEIDCGLVTSESSE